MSTAPVSTFDPRAAALAMAALGSQTTTAAPAKDKATIYLAIGTLRDDSIAPGEEGFDVNTSLINLPQMQGLDNMNPDTRKAGTVEFANSQAESNDFLEDLKAQALATMEPGERRILPLYVSIYRKKDEVVAEAPATPRVRKSFL
jgi:hypothetical protein